MKQRFVPDTLLSTRTLGEEVMSRQESLQKLRTALVTRAQMLRRALDGDLSLLRELHQERTGDPIDAATDTLQDELNSQLVEAESRELVLVESAIARLDRGEFGDCEECGIPIPLTRLRAVPFATECIDCRRRGEAAAEGIAPATWRE